MPEPRLIQRLNMLGNEELPEGPRLEGHIIKGILMENCVLGARNPSKSGADNYLVCYVSLP